MLIGEALEGGATGEGMTGRLSGSSRPSLLKKLVRGGSEGISSWTQVLAARSELAAAVSRPWLVAWVVEPRFAREGDCSGPLECCLIEVRHRRE